MLIYIYISAVVAKAPRKNIAAGRSSVLSPSSGSGKKKSGGSGHSLKLWPVPKGQKGLQSFLNGNATSGSSEGAGSSSGEGPGCSNAGPSSSESEQWDRIEGALETSAHEDASSEDNQEENDTESDEETEVTNPLTQLLDGDIAQLNSDDSDND